MTIRMGLVLGLMGCSSLFGAGALVFQTDFGTKDGAVAAMKGVAVGVDPRLPIFDLSHENTPFNIWEAAYRLKQTAAYWPAGTVFVSVVDPGVGTDRKSVVLRTESGHFFVGPDNGSWTLVADDLGIEAVRRIDETRNRLKGSEKSYTFHGRDVYAFTGALLAAGKLAFDDVGPELERAVVRLPYAKAKREGSRVVGNIPALDIQYGNIWTNIPDGLFSELKPAYGDRFKVRVLHSGKPVFTGDVPYVATFGAVKEGEPLLYLNSLLNVALALNMDSMARRHGISAGGEWVVEIEKASP